MMKHFNQLTPAEFERLALLAEECSEVIQIVGKILRHGYESYNPKDERKRTNRELLEREIGDVQFATFFMSGCGDIDASKTEDFMRLKNMTVTQYLHHQEN